MVSEEKLLSDGMLVEAREASDEDLLVVHTRRYLNELKVQGRRSGDCHGPEGLPTRRNGQRRGSSAWESAPLKGICSVPSARGACESVVPKRKEVS